MKELIGKKERRRRERKIAEMNREIDWCVREARAARAEKNEEWIQCLHQRHLAAAQVLQSLGAWPRKHDSSEATMREAPADTVSDGFGSEWATPCEQCGQPVEVVRPGKVQCGCNTDPATVTSP